MLETTEKIVYASLSLEPAHVSEVASETGLGIPDVMDCLLSLEMKGLIDTVGNNYYAIKNEILQAWVKGRKQYGKESGNC